VGLDEELNARDVHLAFAGLKDPVKDKLVRYGLLDTIDHRHFFPTLDVAVEAFEAFGRPDGTAAEPIGSGP
jgi:STAS domain